MRSILAAILAFALELTLSGCGPLSEPGASESGAKATACTVAGSDTGPIAVSSSYLAAAVRDLLGEDVELSVLAEPGMCPGHFDLRPSQVRQLHSCAMLVRFDFQRSLDSRLDETDGSPRVVAVHVSGGMCEPESYESVCRQLAEALVKSGRIAREAADRQLAEISPRLGRLSDWAKSQVADAGLRDTPVLSSGHQAAFCRWLGLDVAAPFSAADTATPGQIDKAVQAGHQAGARLVIANLPEGRQLADALADRLHARVVVFGNFPDGKGPQAFDDLVRRNVTSLVETAER